MEETAVCDATSIVQNVGSREGTCHAHPGKEFNEKPIPKPSENSKNRIFVTLEINREKPSLASMGFRLALKRTLRVTLTYEPSETLQSGGSVLSLDPTLWTLLQITDRQPVPTRREGERAPSPNCSLHS